MARVEVDTDRVRVRFSPTEKALGLVGDLTVPRSAVRSAHLLTSWREVRGWRVGLGVPRGRMVGTWRWRGHRQLVSLERGLPAVGLELTGARYDEVLVSTPEAERVQRLLEG